MDGFQVIGTPTPCYRPGDSSTSGWELRRLRRSGVETDCKIRAYVPSGTPTLSVYGGTGSANPHTLAAGWQTVTSRLRAGQMADDLRGPYVRLTHTSGDIYVAWVEVDQNKPPYAGVYTPTLTQYAGGNVTGFSNYECQYTRVGDVVSVGGKVTISPSAANTFTFLGISLPVNSNPGGDEDCTGTAVSYGIPAIAASIRADVTNDRAVIYFTPTTTIGYDLFFQFIYQVIG